MTADDQDEPVNTGESAGPTATATGPMQGLLSHFCEALEQGLAPLLEPMAGLIEDLDRSPTAVPHVLPSLREVVGPGVSLTGMWSTQMQVISGRLMKGAFSAMFAAFALLSFESGTQAAPIAISATPQQTGGSFRHNVFHTAHALDGQGGNIRAHFDLAGPAGTSTYDPVTGTLIAHMNVFSDQGLSDPIGTVTASGSIDRTLLNDPVNGTVAGSLTWSFSFSDFTNGLVNHIRNLGNTLDAANPDFDISMTFLSDDFVTSADGRVANSYANNTLTLWGADGLQAGTSKYPDATIGADVVFLLDPGIEVVPSNDPPGVPAPGALLLFAAASAGLAARRALKG